ncbi:type III restriction endonuclease subunit R [Lactobacillus delbrueckii]|uniref:DEAD/DEAH box helicase n=1 Tax=Lactobacillus delbrueckii TaxID=1584 RepID=UPI001F3C112D|nr:DEAD/DEAH box helicase family protein [Lactobacillus delbrueckii]GHN45856.1 type III restriction endonuclease subunit R [Lactobacillus delbrueckii]GHN56774.1 type III restriction endonuclease subunit R [Lactobacillus delbrueckii]
MSGTVSKIKYAMSLRTPQEEALSYLDAISTHCDYKRDDKETVEAAASEYSENNRKVRTKFDFPSFCYAMATGIGKTRLVGACIYYLYKTKGYKHFFILAPGNTIYDKLRKESNPAHPKYIFKGLEAEMGRPRVWDGENYDQYPVKYEQGSLFVDHTSEIQLFIFNIGKIFNSKTDTQFNFHKFKETLGASFADVLAQFDDLVICMDEAHHYYAPASMKSINYLRPILGLEFTATPKSPSNVIYSYDVARGAAEGYLKIPVVMGRSNIAGYSQDDIEEMKIRDGLTLHEHRKTVLREYCANNELDYVKPIVLIACKDTEHAKKIRALIDSDDFMNGKYKGKVIEIHSKQTGEESEENVRLLLSIESAANPIEIVLHVYKLKEGWDVNNLFTIIPLNAAKSDILAMQTIGRGLRLPFGEQTGNEDLDTLDIVAHDHYRELVDEIRNSDIFRYRDLDKSGVEDSESVDVSSTFEEGQLSFVDEAITAAGIKSFDQVRNPQTQLEIYQAYVKNFMASQQKNRKSDDPNQLSLFDVAPEVMQTGETQAASTAPDSATAPAPGNKAGSRRPMTQEEFTKTVTEYSAKAISVPKILVQTTSEVKFIRFEVKCTIQDFEIATAKIERFDAINQHLLTVVDAQALEVEDARNTLACMLLDSISELSYDDADFIIDVVEQYLAQMPGDEEEKKKIVRRYAGLIVNDIKKQIYAHMDRKTQDVHIVQKDLIVFRKFVKNVKKDGQVRYDKPFTDKSNIKKYLFTGYKKSYYPANAFDSDTERQFSIILEEDPDVIRWIKPPLNQLGLFWKAGQQYNPDFIVETTTGKYMVEVKALNEVNNEEVVSKAREGIRWCTFATTADPDHKSWEYRLISDDNIHPGNTCKYTLGTAHPIKEED